MHANKHLRGSFCPVKEHLLQPSLYLGTFSVYIVTQFFPFWDFDGWTCPNRTKSPKKHLFFKSTVMECTLFQLIAVPAVNHCLPTGGRVYAHFTINMEFYIFLGTLVNLFSEP